jgi:hypothetical protein
MWWPPTKQTETLETAEQMQTLDHLFLLTVFHYQY